MRHAVCTEQHMSETRFGLGRFVLAAIVPALLLAGCSSSTSSEHQNEGGSGGANDAGIGGSEAGSGSAGVSGAAPGGSGAGGSVNHAGSGGQSGNAGEAGASGANAAGGGGEPLPCGSVTCGASQYCVIPCCGGTAPACFPVPSDSKCPAGSHSGCTTGPAACAPPANCCQYDPCSPPPPFCSDAKPALCFPTPGLPDPGQSRTCRQMCA